ncbi:rhomboid-like protein 14, mitochondrial [Dioscorea cayenensis subsp. rotundata]|uniref:Rhomboid-like protein 14, mitochondrial n=1 Tax=Dioscorea cayennensis subsp. rotundata TaxID=55577 RepID=A0AB40CMJ7_DIOCR|nr:rhomboid-like protein 14, mitochondrial [Dioscorea cayenensis subsp. rotundata]
MEFGRRRRRVSMRMLPLLALHVAYEYRRAVWKPPVTAGLLLANTLVYLRPGALHHTLPTIDRVFFNPHLILKYGDAKRFFLSPFYHIDDSHLVCNMMSLLWKGIQLETSMGSIEFASMVTALVGISQGITLLLAKALLIFFGYEDAYYNHYSVGFSGVLFAMKMVLNSQADSPTNVHGLIIPARYAAWAELILIQMFVPRASFLGHLGGILAGLLYLQWRRAHSGSDPLSALFWKVFRIVSWPLRFMRGLFGFRQGRVLGRGRVGTSQFERGLHGVWRCNLCTYDNSVLTDVCEMCSTERGGYGFSSGFQQSNRTSDLSVEELRRRRLQRFDR